MRYLYRIYGLQLESQRALPNLLPGRPDLPIDLTLNWVEAELWADSRALTWQRVLTPTLRRKKAITLWQAETAEGSYLKLCFTTAAEPVACWLDPAARRLWIHQPASVNDADLHAYLVGLILGCVLRRRGLVCLHASVVAVQGKAVIIFGPKQAGKSTTAAALAQAGAIPFSDDIAALVSYGEGFCVPPGYPQLRLWPSALQSLYGGAGNLPQVFSNLDKRYLKFSDARAAASTFDSTALPLAAIYQLGKRSARVAEPAITPLSPPEGLVRLIANTYASYVANAELRAHEFAVLSRVANLVPVRRVERPDDLGALAALSQTILADLQQLIPAA